MNKLNDFQNYAKNHLGVNHSMMNDYTKNFNNNVPKSMTRGVVIESTDRISVIDVFSKLMENRTIFIGTGIDDEIANVVVAQMLYLESIDSSRPIDFMINSPGGSVYSGLGIYDTAQYISNPVRTTCVGMAASMGFVLMLMPENVKDRFALPHARLMQHQPMSGIQGGSQASDIQIVNDQIQLLKKELYDIISSRTGQSYETILKDADRDHWLTAEQAKNYGVVGEVLIKREKK